MERRSDIRPEQALEDAYRIPLFATLLFVVMMVAIILLGRHVSAYYAPDIPNHGEELVSVS